MTVSAAASNSATEVAYLDANGHVLVDADSNASGFQVAVAVGGTPISMRLASGGAALTYTVVVERDSTALYGWTPTRDLNNLLQDNPDLAGDRIRGVWADDTTIYISGNSGTMVFAYTRADGSRDEIKDFAINQGSLRLSQGLKAGIWSDGATMWMLDYYYGEDMDGTDTPALGTGKVFAYNLSDGERDTAEEFPLHLATNSAAGGIWSDGSTVWVSDWSAAKLFAYTLNGGARDSDKDITLHHLNDSPQGIWSDGTTIWVAQFVSYKILRLHVGQWDVRPRQGFRPGARQHIPP